nr:MAG TPA: hypothetical protein [Caudoviricetes sp.]
MSHTIFFNDTYSFHIHSYHSRCNRIGIKELAKLKT